MTSLRFRAVDETLASRQLGSEFALRWPAYRRWFLREGDAARPDYRTARAMLARHMPELVVVYDRLLTSLEADEDQARFLSLWCPPDFMHGCTQAIWRWQPYGLIRNYDYGLDSCDALLKRTAWLGSTVLAMSDCVWGVLDGMNAAGLAVSLSFGGRRVSGPGFGVTLILRYILETCRNAPEALAVLQRVPVHLSYNIALVDRDGGWYSVAIAPDRPPELRHEPYSANRQGEHAWPDDRSLSDTVRREVVLAACLDNPRETEAGLIQHFLERPLYQPLSEGGWGTLYTSAYRPAEGVMEVCWPHQRWRQSLAAFTEAEQLVAYQ
jgi:predicted choloylglycine hydrolase